MKTFLQSSICCAIVVAVAGCQMPLFTNSFGSSKKQGDQVASNDKPSRPTTRPGINNTRRNQVDQKLIADYVEQGRRALASNQLSDAEINFEAALQVDPNNSVAHQLMGQIGDRSGRFDVAQFHYLQALTQRPNDADLLSDMGYSYMQQGRFREAKEKLFESLRVSPQHRMAKINMAAVLTYEGDPQKGMAYLKQVGSPQEAQQIMANLMKKAEQFQDAEEIRLANSEADAKLSPEAIQLKKEMQKARSDAGELRGRRDQRERLEIQQRMSQVFGPDFSPDGTIQDADINAIMQNLDQQHQQQLNQLSQNQQLQNQQFQNQQGQNQQGQNSVSNSPYVKLNDGRLGVVDPRTGQVVPLPDMRNQPPVQNQQLQNQQLQNQRPNVQTPYVNRQHPDLMQIPNQTRPVIPNRPQQFQPLVDPNQLPINQNNAQRNQPQPIGPSFPNGVTQNNFRENTRPVDGVNRSNANVGPDQRDPGTWNVGDRNKTGVVAADMNATNQPDPALRAMKLGLSVGPGGFLPPDVFSNQSQQTTRRQIAPIGQPQRPTNGQQQTQQPQQPTAPLGTGQPNGLRPNPNVPGQRDLPSSNNVWNPAASQVPLQQQGVPLSAFDHSSTQGSLGPSNWVTMPTSAPAQVPSGTWNHETHRPYQPSGHRTLTRPMSEEWRTGAFASPSLTEGFGQPRIMSRDPQSQSNPTTNNGEATTQMDLNRHRHNLSPQQSNREIFREQIRN